MPNEQKVTRKLRAIISADVKGYSLLMADDEVHTIQTLKAYRQIMSDLIQQHTGRVVDNPGDNLLAEFGSAVDAVDCAVQIQKRLKKENAKFVDEKQLQFRIGVNIGDVVQDGNGIYGSGVNIAARIEGLADPGGICISRNTYNHVKDKLEFDFRNFGEHQVKNITDPVRVYKVLFESESRKPFLGEKLELPEKPSIAVLPFDNMSGDTGHDYIADGISESIISALSKCRGLFVIARNSTFIYKGKPTKIQKIAEELSVRYVLEGSVLKAGDRIRVIVQLIDAPSGTHLWSEQYDRELSDFFLLLDQITKRVVIELQGQITEGDQARIWQKSTKNFSAWGYFVRAVNHWHYMTKEGFSKAIELFNRVINIEPNNSAAIAAVGTIHIGKILSGYSDSVVDDFNQAVELVKTNEKMDTPSHFTHACWSLIHLASGDHDKSIVAAEKAVFYCPNDPYAQFILSFSHYFAGNFTKSLSTIEYAKRLTPYPITFTLWLMGFNYRKSGQYEKALEAFEELLDRANKGQFSLLYAHNYLACTYSMKNSIETARYHVSELLKIDPNHSLDFNRQTTFFKNPADLEPIIEALRKAGVPDHPLE